MFNGVSIVNKIFSMEEDSVLYTISFNEGFVSAQITHTDTMNTVRSDTLHTCPHRKTTRDIGSSMREEKCSICGQRKVIDSGDFK